MRECMGVVYQISAEFKEFRKEMSDRLHVLTELVECSIKQKETDVQIEVLQEVLEGLMCEKDDKHLEEGLEHGEILTGLVDVLTGVQATEEEVKAQDGSLKQTLYKSIDHQDISA